jgi:hypothetical protein
MPVTINNITNNGIQGFQIFDEQGNEYFLVEETEELALAKYNAIKESEAKREYEKLNPPYNVLRAKEYPPMADYLDAKVKQASTEEAIRQQGIEQEKKYLADCLAVKAKYPKV